MEKGLTGLCRCFRLGFCGLGLAVLLTFSSGFGAQAGEATQPQTGKVSAATNPFEFLGKEKWQTVTTPGQTSAAQESLKKLKGMIESGQTLTLGAPGPDGLPRAVTLPRPEQQMSRPEKLGVYGQYAIMPQSQEGKTEGAAENPAASEAALADGVADKGVVPASMPPLVGSVREPVDPFTFHAKDWKPVNASPEAMGIKPKRSAKKDKGAEPMVVEQRQVVALRYAYLPSRKFVELQGNDMDDEIRVKSKSKFKLGNLPEQRKKDAAAAKNAEDVATLEALRQAVQSLGAAQAVNVAPRGGISRASSAAVTGAATN